MTDPWPPPVYKDPAVKSRWPMWVLTVVLCLAGIAVAVLIAMASLPSGRGPRP